MNSFKKNKTYHIGLVDADLLCNGTRHPNLALLKIAGYLRDNGYTLKSSESILKVILTNCLQMNAILRNFRN